jgi:hypothetical protein
MMAWAGGGIEHSPAPSRQVGAAGPSESLVGTLVERSSRYLVLLHRPDGAGTDSVIR